MKSIINAPHPSISIFSLTYLKTRFTPTKMPNWCEAASSRFPQMHKRNRMHLLPTRVGSASATLFIAATSTANSRDLSVLLQTSAVMLFAYWIANFVVPEFVLRDLQADKTMTDGKDDDNSPDNRQENTQATSTPSSGQEKKGSESTKQS